jgi:hypothetical protein
MSNNISKIPYLNIVFILIMNTSALVSMEYTSSEDEDLVCTVKMVQMSPHGSPEDRALKLTLVSLLPNTPPDKIPSLFARMPLNVSTKALGILSGVTLPSYLPVEECQAWEKVLMKLGVDRDRIEQFGNQFKYMGYKKLSPEESTTEKMKAKLRGIRGSDSSHSVALVDNYEWNSAVSTLDLMLDDPNNPISLGNFPARNNTMYPDLSSETPSDFVEILPGLVHIFNRKVPPVLNQTIKVTSHYAPMPRLFANIPKKVAFVPVARFADNERSLYTYHVYDALPTLIRQEYKLFAMAGTMKPLEWLAHRVAYMVKDLNATVCSAAYGLYCKYSPETLFDDVNMHNKICVLAGGLSYKQNFLFHKVLTRYACGPKGDGEIAVEVSLDEAEKLTCMPPDVHAIFRELRILPYS